MLSKVYPIGMAPSVALALLVPARKVLVSGDERASALAMRIAARSACNKRQVLFISGDNRFDPYAVSRLAKSMGARPEDALRSILIARAFTAYQLVELVDRLGANRPSDFVVISGPCSTFFDDDVPMVDAARLFYRVLWRIVELSHSGMTMLLVQGRAGGSARRTYFLTDLLRASDVILHLGGEHSFTLEHRGRAKLPQLAAIDRLISS